MTSTAIPTFQGFGFQTGRKLVDVLSLTELAYEANRQHRQVTRLLRSTIHHARAAGEALTVAKKKVGFGNWSKWLKTDFDSSPETARVYMRIAKYWDCKLKAAVEANPNLTIEEARQILRPEPYKENGTNPYRIKPLPDTARSGLCFLFERWMDNLPDEAVIVLYNNWDNAVELMFRLMEKGLGLPDKAKEKGTKTVAATVLSGGSDTRNSA
jgi:Protein of unknown function (DUF3102)